VSAAELLVLLEDLAANRGGCLDDWAYADVQRLDNVITRLKQATLAALWDRLNDHVAQEAGAPGGEAQGGQP
jgi:hypothetical protein